MKIKTKKQMTHEEYAKHMIDKFGIASYERELIDNNIFDAPMEFEQTFTLNSMRKDDDPVIERSFKGVVVEVEEEVTEDTLIPKLLTTFETINVKNKVRYQRVRIDENYTIKLMLNIAEAHREPVETLHIVNDDGTHTLIWRDGRLVE